MILKLTIYKDDLLQEVERTVEADRLKIPYRVATEVGKSLENIDTEDNKKILNLISVNMESVDKILKSTFGLNDSELECIDAAEMAAVVKEIYQWAIGKMKGIKGGEEKNSMPAM